MILLSNKTGTFDCEERERERERRAEEFTNYSIQII